MGGGAFRGCRDALTLSRLPPQKSLQREAGLYDSEPGLLSCGRNSMELNGVLKGFLRRRELITG